MVTAKVKVGSAVLEVQADTPKALFKQLGAFSEILSEQTCGSCGSTEIRFEYRRAGDANEYEYFSIRCAKCRAQLDFGQHKNGATLFGKRGGEHAETRGWYEYQKDGDGQRHPPDDGRQAPPDDDLAF